MTPFPLSAKAKSDLQAVPSQDVPRLFGLVRDLRGAANAFISFAEGERLNGSSLGLESITAELALVSMDEQLGRVEGALSRATKQHEPAALSEQGFSKLRRLESILGDARWELNRRLGQEEPHPSAPLPPSPPRPWAASAAVVGLVALGIYFSAR